MGKYVLMIAEKPSVAFEVARIMSAKRMVPDKSGPTPVHDLTCVLDGCEGMEVKFTAVTGHLNELDLPEEYNDWKLDPKVLFECPLKTKAINDRLNEHIKNLALDASQVVFWMDNDREGEAICFEAMDIINEGFKAAGKEIPRDFYKRALISAITQEDVEQAMKTLGYPNSAINDASLTRQEVDLRVGFAFTRLLTKSLKFVSTDLFGKVVSFGPCQTPALALCVDGEGSTFGLNLKDKDGKTVTLQCTPISEVSIEKQSDEEGGRRGTKADIVSGPGKELKIVSRKKDIVYVDPPPALNTVSFIKYASAEFDIPPTEAMEVAEKLYLKGLISYPRTETSSYPQNINYKGILDKLGELFDLDDQIDDLNEKIDEKVREANERDGANDAGDHTPIIPITTRPNFIETAQSVTGLEQKLFFLVVRVFLASISHHARVEREVAVVDYAGNQYEVKSDHMKNRGFTKFINTIGKGNKSIALLDTGKVESVTNNGIKESTLIELMDKKGIGTDATIATHINTLYTRGLCNINDLREIKPTKKGQCIIRALEKSDPGLVDPGLRRSMEEQFISIEKGAPKKDVLKKCLDGYLDTYKKLEENMELTKSFVKTFVAENGTD